MAITVVGYRRSLQRPRVTYHILVAFQRVHLLPRLSVPNLHTPKLATHGISCQPRALHALNTHMHACGVAAAAAGACRWCLLLVLALRWSRSDRQGPTLYLLLLLSC